MILEQRNKKRLLYAILFAVLTYTIFLFATLESGFAKIQRQPLTIERVSFSESPPDTPEALNKLSLSYKKYFFDKHLKSEQNDYDFDRLPEDYVQQIIEQLQEWHRGYTIKNGKKIYFPNQLFFRDIKKIGLTFNFHGGLEVIDNEKTGWFSSNFDISTLEQLRPLALDRIKTVFSPFIEDVEAQISILDENNADTFADQSGNLTIYFDVGYQSYAGQNIVMVRMIFFRPEIEYRNLYSEVLMSRYLAIPTDISNQVAEKYMSDFLNTFHVHSSAEFN